MYLKVISSLEKCFLDETVAMKPSLSSISMLKNERYSFQVCYQAETIVDAKVIMNFRIESPLAEYINVYKVKSIPSEMPVYKRNYDDYYLRTTPGLYPDLLEPIRPNDRLTVNNNLTSLWLEVFTDSKVDAGVYPAKCIFTDPGNGNETAISTEIEIIGAELPPQELIFTQWFYTDCLMQYYDTKAFSEKHWKIIENFMGNAKKYGMNMILTPILTPALDTYVGGERPTTQLVDVTVTNGKYSFDFSKLGRWVDLCDKVGIKYLEINHFFTQWGAAACPKVVAKVDGKQKRIFGWDTPSDGEAYKEFLYALIPQMLDYLKSKNGADKRCYFHLSDEPSAKHFEQYTKISNMIKPLLKGYPIMDALSDYSFYESGATTCPIPCTNHMDEFLKHDVPNLWTYYCCGPAKGGSNRFFSMPSARTRIIGTQFYKFNIAGFLHWGYNFYNSQYSYAQINPFLCSDGECFAPSGDAYSVYPGTKGEPWPSLRQVVFHEAIQDLRALKLCEQLYGREYTMNLLEDGIEPITFMSYPHETDYLLRLRRRVNKAIAEKVK